MENKQKTIEQKIEEWKRKYGSVYSVEVKAAGVANPDSDEAGVKVCYLRKPDRKALSAASVVGAADPFKYNEILLSNCWIEGDEEIRTDDSYFLGVSAKLGELIEIKEASIKKL